MIDLNTPVSPILLADKSDTMFNDLFIISLVPNLLANWLISI